MRGLGRSSLCAQQAGFAERTGQKIILQGQLPDLGVKYLHLDRRRSVGWSTAGAKYPRSSVNQLPLPCRDLVRMHIIVLR